MEHLAREADGEEAGNSALDVPLDHAWAQLLAIPREGGKTLRKKMDIWNPSANAHAHNTNSPESRNRSRQTRGTA